MTNCLGVFHHFVGQAVKGLKKINRRFLSCDILFYFFKKVTRAGLYTQKLVSRKLLFYRDLVYSELLEEVIAEITLSLLSQLEINRQKANFKWSTCAVNYPIILSKVGLRIAAPGLKTILSQCSFFIPPENVRKPNPADNYLFKVNKRNIKTSCEVCSKLTKKAPLLLTLNMFHSLFQCFYC